MERQCLEELSRYYRLAVRPAYDGDEAKWVRKSLIKEGEFGPDNPTY